MRYPCTDVAPARSRSAPAQPSSTQPAQPYDATQFKQALAPNARAQSSAALPLGGEEKKEKSAESVPALTKKKMPDYWVENRSLPR